MEDISSEQIKLFRKLFSGQENAYGIMGSKGAFTKREPLTNDILLRHLRGLDRIGCFPIVSGKTKWALVDVDELNQEKVTRVFVACIENNLFPYIERSREKGYHVWLFFDEPIEAKDIRKVLEKILQDAQIKDCEIFPKQDWVDSDNGVGNYVFLPLQGQSIKEKRTVFLNGQFEPYEDQWDHLSNINPTKSENVLSIAELIPEKKYRETKRSTFDTSKPPRGVKVCYWKALNGGVEQKDPGRHVWALRISKHLQKDQGLSPDIARAALIQWNQKNKPPLTEREFNLDRTVADGIKYDYGCNDEVLKRLCSQECRYFKSSLKDTSENLFPAQAIEGLAGEFADLYSSYLESPWTFFAFNFLTCLGSLISDRITLESEISPQPRFYTVNIGESADDRKSESIKKTIQVFDSVLTQGEFRVCHGVGSAEGLARKLGEVEHGSKKLLLVYDELKSFVGKAMIEGATLLPAVNTFFESNKFHSATKTHSVELNDVFLSLLGASTLETFSRMWTPAFLDIGFLNRLWLVKDHSERRFSIPKEIPSSEINGLHRKLGDLLKKFSQPIKLPISQNARAIFDQWYFNIESSPFTKRLDTYGLRLMILLTVNEGLEEVTEETAIKVIELLQWQLKIRREVDPIDAEGSIAKMEEMIRRALANGPLHKRDLQKKINYQRIGIFAWNAAVRNLLGAREISFNNRTGIYQLAT